VAELLPDLLNVRVVIIEPDGRELARGPADGPALYLVRTTNHYMPALRRPGPIGSGRSTRSGRPACSVRSIRPPWLFDISLCLIDVSSSAVGKASFMAEARKDGTR
jgi:hypothetical protein